MNSLLVVSGTEVTIGEDPIEGQSWTIGVLLVTVGVVLLSCACIVSWSTSANWKCTCDERIRRLQSN